MYREQMLYNAYEMQRSMLAGASAWANFSAELLSNPSNPFAYFGGGPVVASALEVFAPASAPRGKLHGERGLAARGRPCNKNGPLRRDDHSDCPANCARV